MYKDGRAFGTVRGGPARYAVKPHWCAVIPRGLRIPHECKELTAPGKGWGTRRVPLKGAEGSIGFRRRLPRFPTGQGRKRRPFCCGTPTLTHMQRRSPRVVAICVFSHDGKILARKGHDPVTGQTFFRPIGGGVGFGERAHDALVREVREELHQQISDLRYVGHIENLFQYGGKAGHEVVLVYDGRFDAADPYTVPRLALQADGGPGGEAHWIRPADLDKETPLYPEGLGALLIENVPQ